MDCQYYRLDVDVEDMLGRLCTLQGITAGRHYTVSNVQQGHTTLERLYNVEKFKSRP